MSSISTSSLIKFFGLYFALHTNVLYDAWTIKMIYKNMLSLPPLCVYIQNILANVHKSRTNTTEVLLFLRIFILFLKHYSLSVYFRCIFGSAILNSHKHLLFFFLFQNCIRPSTFIFECCFLCVPASKFCLELKLYSRIDDYK